MKRIKKKHTQAQETVHLLGPFGPLFATTVVADGVGFGVVAVAIVVAVAVELVVVEV